MASLLITEIFQSIQGESTHAGRPCVFVRLSRCNLRCAYCDTAYAWKGGRSMTLQVILKKIGGYHCNLVEMTGGEPLLQAESIVLMKALLQKKYQVLLETNGSQDIRNVPRGVVKILDIKTPGSDMEHYNCYANLKFLGQGDEVKFVITDKKDYRFAKEIIRKYNLGKRCAVLLSPVPGKTLTRELAEWILEDNLQARLNLQLHKIVWPKTKRGV